MCLPSSHRQLAASSSAFHWLHSSVRTRHTLSVPPELLRADSEADSALYLGEANMGPREGVQSKNVHFLKQRSCWTTPTPAFGWWGDNEKRTSGVQHMKIRKFSSKDLPPSQASAHISPPFADKEWTKKDTNLC